MQTAGIIKSDPLGSYILKTTIFSININNKKSPIVGNCSDVQANSKYRVFRGELTGRGEVCHTSPLAYFLYKIYDKAMKYTAICLYDVFENLYPLPLKKAEYATESILHPRGSHCKWMC